MFTERFITFLRANLNDFIDKLDQFEESYKRNPNTWSIEQFLEEVFSNPSQRRQFEDAYDRYQNLYGDEQKSNSRRQDSRGDNPFDKFEYYYNKYEQNFEQQDQQYQNYYQRRKQQQSSYSRNQTNDERKYYDALEIDPGASFEEIKKAYKKAMMKYHPDKFTGDDEKQRYAEQLSRKINEAYEYFKKKFNQ